MNYLFIAGHGKKKDGSFDPGARGYISQGEHAYYKETLFPLMKEIAPSNVIFHDAYNVYDQKNIVGLAHSYGLDTSVVEWHFDAWKEEASGGHVIVHKNKTPNKVDKSIRDVIKAHIGLANRTHKGVVGLDGRSDFYNPNVCHKYGVDYRMVELGFGTNRRDSQIMLGQAPALARDLVEAITGTRANESSNPGTPIAGQAPTVSIDQMRAWAKKRGANELFICLAEKFYEVALGRKLDPALLYAQAAKETAFMNFTGVLDSSFCNPCGLKTSQGGDNKDPSAHERFRNWEKGIKAQADHLNLYAGAKAYPMKDSPDPRHFPRLLGTAKTVEALGGKWAGSPTYGKEIRALMSDLQIK